MHFAHVASGHAKSFQVPSDESQDRPKTVLKTLDNTELSVYTHLAEHATDPIREFVPEFHGVHQDGEQKFIRIANLLHDFQHPRVMDVKIGCRTQLESERHCSKSRPDLFERMQLLYPEELSPVEVEARSVTKHRWMSTRDKCSTIKPLSFRVDGVTGYGRERSMSSEDLTSMRSMEDTIRVFRAFAEEAVRESISDANAVQPSVVAEGVRSKLVRLRDAMRASDFVAHHEFIGTSVLIVADGTRTDIFWIDFAKTHGVTGSLTHRGSCHLRIHQDGIIHGLENLIVAWTRVSRVLHCQTHRLPRPIVRRCVRSPSYSEQCGKVGWTFSHTGNHRRCVVRDPLQLPVVKFSLDGSVPCFLNMSLVFRPGEKLARRRIPGTLAGRTPTMDPV